MSRRVLVIETGGTIASRPGADGRLAPGRGLAPLIEAAAKGLDIALQVEPWRDPDGAPRAPVDSCDIGPEDWIGLARQVEASSADAVVVLHGTDTLAWTASALAFALPFGHKPVILTGAMRPAGAPRTDARRNVRLALAAAAGAATALQGEVAVAFAGALSRGLTTTKIDGRALDAFDSRALPKLRPSRPHAFEAAAELWRASRPGLDRCAPFKGFQADVAVVTLAPGMTARRIDDMLTPRPAGVVFRLFGAGSAPSGLELHRLVDDLAREGVLSVAVSAAPRAVMDFSAYASAAALAGSQLVCGRALTLEAAVVKSMWAAAAYADLGERRQALARDLRGEFGGIA
ncbi:asparaginase domain-containing protein [Phenylobacterium sp.]|uniref:asparaginase domain-containing protein n=1 Tax=Phenylobacterium sp. TaxID=1871053 RepID=UPI0035AF2FE3